MEREELIRKINRKLVRLNAKTLRRIYYIIIGLEELEEAGI